MSSKRAKIVRASKRSAVIPEPPRDAVSVKDTVIHYIKLYPHMPSKTLARLLCHVRPRQFYSIEQARDAVRYLRGGHGVRNRVWQADENLVRSEEEAMACRDNPFGVPDGFTEDDWAPFEFPMDKARGLLIADTHAPFHSPDALVAAINDARKNKFLDFIFINGDFGDHYQVSKFEKRANARNYSDEIVVQRDLLASLCMLPGFPRVFFKAGNHDARLLKYMSRVCPQLVGASDDFTLPSLLNMREMDVTFIEHDMPTYFGKLNIMHGHEFQRGTGITVNPARTAFLRAKECVLVAHSHQWSSHDAQTVRGRHVTSWSVGCMCDLHPAYCRLNEWVHGFALLEKDGENFEIINKRLIKGVGVV